MSPKRLPTKPADKAWAAGRRRVAETYADVARLLKDEDGLEINACIGIAVIAGIAAGDAISAAAIGERCSGQDHAAAAELLKRVDDECGKRLSNLVALKPQAHYGNKLLTARDRTGALRDMDYLVNQAHERTGGTA